MARCLVSRSAIHQQRTCLGPAIHTFFITCAAAETTFYGAKGQVLRTFTTSVEDPPTVLRVFRDEIGRQLIDEAQRLYPDAIKFHFNCPIEAVDLDQQTVSVLKGKTSQVSIYVLYVTSCTSQLEQAFDARFRCASLVCTIPQLSAQSLCCHTVALTAGVAAAAAASICIKCEAA